MKSAEVIFSILESELKYVKTGTKFTISPLSDSKVVVGGEVSEINPSIDENGGIKVKGRVGYEVEVEAVAVGMETVTLLVKMALNT